MVLSCLIKMSHHVPKAAAMMKIILFVFIVFMVTFSSLNAEEKRLKLSAERGGSQNSDSVLRWEAQH